MKIYIAILIIFTLSISCNEKDKSNRTILISNDSLIIRKAENKKNTSDTTVENGKLLKFMSNISFSDFRVKNIDNKHKAKLDFTSNENAINFITRLRNEYKSDSSNFAGHYSFVFWSCGSPCQSSLIIDRQTGKIYDSPGASLGYEFYPDSRMLIINPPDSNGFYEDCFYCKPIIYIFNENLKKFEEHK